MRYEGESEGKKEKGVARGGARGWQQSGGQRWSLCRERDGVFLVFVGDGVHGFFFLVG